MTVFILLFNIVLYSLPAMAGMAILGYYLQGKYPKTSVGWLTIAGIPLTLMFFWGQTAYYNAEVDRLCAIDGGIKVYEQVVLPANQFKVAGGLAFNIPYKATSGFPYYYDLKVADIQRKGSLVVRKREIKIVRVEDLKVLGSKITYSRGGGDLPYPAMDSVYHCPSLKTQSNFETTIFVRGSK